MLRKAVEAVVLMTLVSSCCVSGDESAGKDGEVSYEYEPKVVEVRYDAEPLIVKLPDESGDEEGAEGGESKRATGDDCYIPGKGYWKRNGEVFTLDGHVCIKYRCSYGQYNIIEEGCDAKNHGCVAVGRAYDVDQCTRFRCDKTPLGNGYIEYRLSNVLGQDKCQVNGRCYNFGEVFEEFCRQRRCVRNGYHGYRIEDYGYQTQCRDENGNCHRQGETFGASIGGRYYHECICNGNMINCYDYGK